MTKAEIKKIKEKTKRWEEKNKILSLRKREIKKTIKTKRKKIKRKKRKPTKKKFSSYKEYMQSTDWKIKREEVLKRANGKCESCKIKRATQIHHKTYKHLYNEPLKDLIALCGICHMQTHKILTQDYIDKKVYDMIAEKLL